jgi:periplasmic divalent cation tolerance protein
LNLEPRSRGLTKAQFLIAFVTAPDLRTARKLARAALKARLAACVNLVPRIESLYWWKGKIETGTEVLMILKTTAPRVGALEKLIVAQHPYETPEFVAVSIAKGNKRFCQWWDASVQ